MKTNVNTNIITERRIAECVFISHCNLKNEIVKRIEVLIAYFFNHTAFTLSCVDGKVQKSTD